MHTSLSVTPIFEELTTSLYQVNALVDVMLGANLAECKPETLANYLWVVSDLLHKANTMCENLGKTKMRPSSLI